MILEIILGLSTLIILVVYFQSRNSKQKKSSDGLKQVPVVSGGLPIIGHYLKIDNLFLYLNDLKGTYGPIFSIQLGWKNVIVINSYDLLHKTFREQGNNFSGRWQNFFTRDMAKNSGILFVEKETWAAQRSFSLRALRDFGFGKRLTENVIHREFEKVSKMIQSKSGQSIDTNELLSLTTLNIICDFIMKKEFDINKKGELSLILYMKETSQLSDINFMWTNLFPIFEWFPSISEKIIEIFPSIKLVQATHMLVHYIGKIVDEHRKDFDPANECQDLIDSFLYEQYKLEKSGEKNHSFTDFQLVRLIAELLFAGFETTSTTLSWALLLLAKYPDVQSRLRDEIMNELGSDKIPMMTDKKSLNYCQAVLDDVYRCSTVLPFAIAHRSIEDAVVDGYFIPGDTIIFPNVYACHRDPTYWKKPYEFYPDHFLDESGNYKPKPELVVFGLGKRQCLGESLARMEEFILLVRFIQTYEVSLDENYKNINIIDILKSKGGSIRGIVEHKLHFKEISDKN